MEYANNSNILLILKFSRSLGCLKISFLATIYGHIPDNVCCEIFSDGYVCFIHFLPPERNWQ